MPDCMKLSGTQLKLLAASIMVVDHVGAVLFRECELFRIIGRMSFPIFCFLMAEGVSHTRSMKKYMQRLLLAAIVSQPFYSLCFSGNFLLGRLNVMFTFLLAGIAIWGYQRLPAEGKWVGVLWMFAMAFLAMSLKTDYGEYGVLLVSLFYLLRERKKMMLLLAGLFQLCLARGIQQYSVMSLIPIAFYNEKRGRNIKYFFYAFYPAHLFAIYLLARCLGIYH